MGWGGVGWGGGYACTHARTHASVCLSASLSVCRQPILFIEPEVCVLCVWWSIPPHTDHSKPCVSVCPASVTSGPAHSTHLSSSLAQPPPLQVALKAGVRAFWLDPRRPDDVIDHLLQITAAPALALALASR